MFFFSQVLFLNFNSIYTDMHSLLKAGFNGKTLEGDICHIETARTIDLVMRARRFLRVVASFVWVLERLQLVVRAQHRIISVHGQIVHTVCWILTFHFDFGNFRSHFVALSAVGIELLQDVDQVCLHENKVWCWIADDVTLAWRRWSLIHFSLLKIPESVYSHAQHVVHW